MLPHTKTTTQITWQYDSLADGTVNVVRTITTTEQLAGPVRAVIHAKRWIAQHANQDELFDDTGQPELFG